MPEMARNLGMKLCEVWGLDPLKVGRIRITLEAQGVAKAEVTVYVDGEAEEQILMLRYDGFQ